MDNIFPNWLMARLPYYAQQEQKIVEEQRRIQEKAGRYDTLVALLGFNDFLNIMMSKIQTEISEATKCPDDPQRQTLHVIRWNAMREVVDAAQNDIVDTIKERDRIREEELEYLREIQKLNEEKEKVNDRTVDAP